MNDLWDNKSVVKREVLDMCRICETMESLIDITQEDFCHFNEKLHKIADLQDKYSSCLKYICHPCSLKLENAFDFKTQCEFTYRKLVDQMDNVGLGSVPYTEPITELCVEGDFKMEIVKEEFEEKFLADPSSFEYIEFPTGTESQDFGPIYDEPDKPKRGRKAKGKAASKKGCSVKKLYKKTRGKYKCKKKPENPNRIRNPYTCANCNEIFDGKNQLKCHIEEKHFENLPCTCKICNAKFICISRLHMHTKKKHKGHKYPCDLCGMILRSQYAADRHKRVSHNKDYKKIPPHLCHFCGHGSPDRYHHAEHLRRHTGETPFKCEECGKSFSKKQKLTIHSSTHRDERPFTCDICPLTFKRKWHLQRHLVTHTGERKYLCKVCGKSYITPCALKVHAKSSHPVELFYEF